jgi:hypothetical protein
MSAADQKVLQHPGAQTSEMDWGGVYWKQAHTRHLHRIPLAINHIFIEKCTGL